MKSRLQHLLAASLCLAVFCVAGCRTPGLRQSVIGRVTARAHIYQGHANYYEIEITGPTEDLAPRFWLRLPDGRIIDRTWFTYAALKKAGFQGSDERDFQPGNSFKYELSKYGVFFLFDNGSLVLMRLSQTSGDGIRIAREHGKRFYTFPLSQEELETLFGRPDKISDEMRW